MGCSPWSYSCRNLHSDAKLKDPFTLAQKDLKSLYDDIRKVCLQDPVAPLHGSLVVYFLCL